MVDEKLNLKCADFDNSAMNKVDGLSEIVGTPGYRAPQIEEGSYFNGYEADIFSVGVMIFIIVTGKRPFNCANQGDPYFKLIKNKKFDEYWPIFESDRSLSIGFKNLIMSMLEYDGA